MTPEGLKRLVEDEGSKPYLYDDATGERITKLPSGGNPTIGVGRNLGANPLSEDEIEYLLKCDLVKGWECITRLLPWVADISPVRQDVIQMVEFNTGDVFMFRKMLAALQSGNFETAADELLDSKAARELPDRYKRMSDALINNTW